MAQAPLNLVYVADFAKMAETPDTTRTLYSAAETGSIGQKRVPVLRLGRLVYRDPDHGEPR